MNNLFKHKHTVSLEKRLTKQKNKPFCVWFTGLSGSGKSTIANALEYKLFDMDIRTYLLDGDNIRLGLNSDLDFTDEGRKENIRRISEVNKLYLDAGLVTLSAFISPFIEDRDQASNIIGKDNFIEVYVDTPLDICEERDPKGLYKLARKGEIKNFTGIDSAYEEPINPNITLNPKSLDEQVDEILNYLKNKNLI